MSFVDSIKYCFNNYANFEGRASRSQFWWFTLFLVLVGWAVELVDFLIFRHNNIHVLYYVWFLVTIVPHLAVAGSTTLASLAGSRCSCSFPVSTSSLQSS